MGWGQTILRNPAPLSATLQNVKLRVNDPTTCPNQRDRNSQLCVGGNQNKSTCNGDSGGPLYVLDTLGGKQRYIVAGIVSYG
jgi:secreted trypsin-like serine protease